MTSAYLKYCWIMFKDDTLVENICTWTNRNSVHVKCILILKAKFLILLIRYKVKHTTTLTTTNPTWMFSFLTSGFWLKKFRKLSIFRLGICRLKLECGICHYTSYSYTTSMQHIMKYCWRGNCTYLEILVLNKDIGTVQFMYLKLQSAILCGLCYIHPSTLCSCNFLTLLLRSCQRGADLPHADNSNTGRQPRKSK